jgi:GntR family transcriptional regulator/MocR family aminotransferase
MSDFRPAQWTFDASAREPLYRQIYGRFRHAIGEGMLGAGDRVPAVRALAAELGVARGTVEAAYASLIADGYLQSHGQRGTTVTQRDATRTVPTTLPLRSEAAPLPFQMGLPALDEFPRKVWARLGSRRLRATRPADLSSAGQAGFAPLRTAIASYVQLARGIACEPAQVFVTAGYRDTLTLIARALLVPGDGIWVEDPGYPPTHELLDRMGMRTIPVDVDDQGIAVDRGIATAPRARAAVVTPAHQSPLCVSLSMPRRLALLAWAARSDAWIVEDDYDGEYRYAGRPLPSLKSLDTADRVVYAGTFSKVLFPGIRLAYAVVPRSQVASFEDAVDVFQDGGAMLTQAIATDFIVEGHFSRHIQKMRRLYAARHAAVTAGLTRALASHFTIAPTPGGMHLVLAARGALDDKAIAARMQADGLFAQALSDWSTRAHGRTGLLLGFTNIASEDRAHELGLRIAGLM